MANAEALFIMIIFGIVMIVIGCGFTYSYLIIAAFNAATISTFVDGIIGVLIFLTVGYLIYRGIKGFNKKNQ